MLTTTDSRLLSPDQVEAYRTATEKLLSGQDCSLDGPAGTGKTTLIQLIAKRLPECLVCAPTGKACEVLGRKGIEAKTLHSWLYAFKGLDEKLQPKFASKRTTRPQYLIVDEASMLTAAIHQEIRSKRIPTLYVGDRFQLPPVHAAPLKMLEHPDCSLRSIHRQAAGSPIIQLAHKIRGGGWIFEPHDGIDVFSVHDSDEIAAHLLAGMDRAIVRTNDARLKINASVRTLLGRTSIIQPGDELICLANDYLLGIINGQQFTVRRVVEETKATITAILEPEYEGSLAKIRMLKAQFGNPAKQQASAGLALFDYGWAITGHKAQGSQWNHVGVLVHGFTTDPQRWNYTAVTRAQNKLTLFRYAR